MPPRDSLPVSPAFNSGYFTEDTSTPLDDEQKTRTMVMEFVDVDNDGDLDVYCGQWNWPDQMYLNDGTGALTLDTRGSLSSDRRYVYVAVFADFNSDGWIDLCVARAPSSALACLESPLNVPVFDPVAAQSDRW